MTTTRCTCCHRYAPKGHGTDAPVGVCAGYRAIEEARDLARLWRTRALEAGWERPDKCEDCGAELAPCHGVKGNYCTACLAERTQEGDALLANLPPKGQGGLRRSGPVAHEEHPPAMCALSVPVLIQGPDSKALVRCANGCKAPPAHPSKVICKPCQEKITAKLEAMANPNPQGPGPGKPQTRDEVLHERWLAEGRNLAYCQGDRRHFFVVGSPMHDQLLKSGCFHCGAFPEISA